MNFDPTSGLFRESLASKQEQQPRGWLSRWPVSGTFDPSAYETRGRRLLRWGILAGFIATAITYFGWRLTVFNPDAMIYSVFFYLAEITGMSIGLLFAFVAWRRPSLACHAPAPGHRVDVFITTYNEPVEVVRRTVLGALAIGYAHETWLLDDGNRDEMRGLAEELGCRYLAREENTGAKAGNLNNALKHATGEFVAIFDADHVAQPDFLEKTLGYFCDPAVGFVQTPQDYFNLDGFQYGRAKTRKLIWHDQSWFHYVGQFGRNSWKAATFCGCSAVLRRSALDTVGGFPEITVTEDMHCAVKMQKNGYVGAFHPEPLAFGIAPVSFKDYLRQRLRWGEGNLQVCRLERLPFAPGLNFGQQMAFLALTVPYVGAVAKLGLYAAPIVLLIAGVPPMVSDPATFATIFVPFLVMLILLFEEIGRGFGNLLHNEKSLMCQLGSAMVALRGLFRDDLKFLVSSKLLDGDHEWWRMLPQVLLLGLSLGAVAYRLGHVPLGLPLGMPVWLVFFITVLALFHSAIAWMVIRNCARVRRIHEDAYHHRAAIPLKLETADGESVVGQTREISTGEFTFEADRPVSASSDAVTSVRLFLPSETLEFATIAVDAKTDGNGRVTGRARFTGTDAEARDRLDLALHGGRWHRLFEGYHEALRTPYDMLYDLLRLGTLKRSPGARWIPVIGVPIGPENCEIPLYVTERLSEAFPRPAMVAFGDVTPGQTIRLEMPGGSPKARSLMALHPLRDVGVADLHSLDCVDGRLYAVEWI